MWQVHQARRIVRAAAVGGGGLGAVGMAAFGLLAAQAQFARRWIGTPFSEAPAGDGVYGSGTGTPIEFAVIGDSSAMGLGVDDPSHTPAVRLAVGLSGLSGRPVRVTVVAVVGACSRDLPSQVDRLLVEVPHPDIAVIMVGANDVTRRLRPGDAVQALESAVALLVEHGCQVVVGTCPDLGAIKPIGPPLRHVARYWGRQLAAAQTIAVVAAGGRTVSLGDLLGPEFVAHPGELFSADRFHPSSRGYARACDALLPSVAVALGLVEDGELSAPLPIGEGLDEVAHAAVRAAASAGTEVSPAPGRWVMLRRRRRATAPPVGPDAALVSSTDAASVTSGTDGDGTDAPYGGGRSSSPSGQLTRP